MSGLNINQHQRPAPRHALYVSIQNGAIQQAMSSPSGYEDEHPEDWRPATYAEQEQYMAGVDNINGNPQPQALPQFAAQQATQLATPTTLQLADETPVDVQLPASPAVAPAPVHHGFPVSPTPAYAAPAPAVVAADVAAADAASLSVGAPAPAPAFVPPPAPPAPAFIGDGDQTTTAE